MLRILVPFAALRRPLLPTLDTMGLDTVELILEAEKHFGVCVPDKRAEKTDTVEKFAHLLYELRVQTAVPLPYEEIFLQLQQMIANKFQISIERIVPEARFIKDLGLDQHSR